MGNRSKQTQTGRPWSRTVTKRSKADHKRKKAAEKQQKHLQAIKSPAAIREMLLAGRRG